jgi:hypothetical protein
MSVVLAVVCAWALLAAPQAPGQSTVLTADEVRLTDDFFWLPYAFYSGSFGLGFGAGFSFSGWPEETSSLLFAITAGTKMSYNIMASGSDIRVPGTRRLYVEPFIMLGRYQDQFIYAGRNNPGFEGQRAGSNDSDPENRVEVTQWDNRAEVAVKYLLPIGHGAADDAIVARYVVREGRVDSPTGATSWNPLESGRTHLILTPQWREQTLENEDLNAPFRTVNLEAAVERDNRDFPFNPSCGSFQRFAYTKDYDSDDRFGGWEMWEAEVDKIIDLGAARFFRQQVIALSFWTADTPTWETETVDGAVLVTRRPPPFEGATIGGINRMRAYEDARFHDKAAIYYGAEYRVIPGWQPLRDIEILSWADIRYWQWVLFVEAGQVSPEWNVSDLNSDLHVDGGFGLRGMFNTAVCRVDFAVGDEGLRVNAMYGHPF